MKIYTLIAVEDCYFKTIEKPAKLRLTAEQVQLNYAAQSPWPDGGLVYRQTASTLTLWFYPARQNTSHGVKIPEGYLLAKPYLDQDAAVLYYEKSEVAIYSVIKQGQLVAQVAFPQKQDCQPETEVRIELLIREYSLVDPTIVHLAATDVPAPTWRDIADFLRIDLDRSLLHKFQHQLKNVAIAMLVMAALYSLFNYIYFQRLVDSQAQQLQSLRQENSTHRQLLLTLTAEAELWQSVQADQPGSGLWLEQIDALADIIQAQNGYLKLLRFSGQELFLQIGLSQPVPPLVEQLLATGLFAESNIVSTRQDRDAPEFDLIDMRLILKTATEAERG